MISHSDLARSLLVAHPQLGYALFQALVLNNIVDPVVLQRMLAATSKSPLNAPAPPPMPAFGAPPSMGYGPGIGQGMARPVPTPPPGNMYGRPPPAAPGYPPAGNFFQPPPQQAPLPVTGAQDINETQKVRATFSYTCMCRLNILTGDAHASPHFIATADRRHARSRAGCHPATGATRLICVHFLELTLSQRTQFMGTLGSLS